LGFSAIGRMDGWKLICRLDFWLFIYIAGKIARKVYVIHCSRKSTLGCLCAVLWRDLVIQFLRVSVRQFDTMKDVGDMNAFV
jgi:hypothetical protein